MGGSVMAYPMGEAKFEPLRVDFDRRLKLEFHGSDISSDAGLLPYRELGDALGLTELGGEVLSETRRGKNTRHLLVGLLRQSVFGRLAGYEDVNDADRLSQDPVMRAELVPRVGFIVTNLSRPAERVTRFYDGRGTAEQFIKEGKNAINWTRLSCHGFRNNEVRLQLHALAYNLGNFLRTLALPEAVEHWSLTTLREKLIKIGAKVVRHGRYITFQMAEVAISRPLFAEILRLINGLRPAPLPP